MAADYQGDAANAVAEWDSFLTDKEDSVTAKRLLKYRYDDLPRAKGLEERARYESEVEFFGCGDDRDSVEELLGKIVEQRYRKITFDITSDYHKSTMSIDLENIPARRFIAAERLFQQKLIRLRSFTNKGHPPNVNVGLKNKPGAKYDWNRGPRENYFLHAGRKCVIELQHASPPDGQSSIRAGSKYANYVGDYEGILATLTEYLNDLDGNRQRFVESLQEMCATHHVTCSVLKGYEWKKRNRLLKILFHILVNEQSQFQSACFIEEADDFKIGIPVSFARLVRLFRDKHISLEELFFKYKLYSTKNVLDNIKKIRETCRKIDEVYRKKYEVNLDKAQALEDLEFLYSEQRVLNSLCDQFGALDLQNDPTGENDETPEVEIVEEAPEVETEDEAPEEETEDEAPEVETEDEAPEVETENEALEVGEQPQVRNCSHEAGTIIKDINTPSIGERILTRAERDLLADRMLVAYTNCLIDIVFTEDELLNCSLNPRNGSTKSRIPEEKLQDFYTHILAKFQVGDEDTERVKKRITEKIKNKMRNRSATSTPLK